MRPALTPQDTISSAPKGAATPEPPPTTVATAPSAPSTQAAAASALAGAARPPSAPLTAARPPSAPTTQTSTAPAVKGGRKPLQPPSLGRLRTLKKRGRGWSSKGYETASLSRGLTLRSTSLTSSSKSSLHHAALALYPVRTEDGASVPLSSIANASARRASCWPTGSSGPALRPGERCGERRSWSTISAASVGRGGEEGGGRGPDGRGANRAAPLGTNGGCEECLPPLTAEGSAPWVGGADGGCPP